MNAHDLNKLIVLYEKGTTENTPIIPRKYSILISEEFDSINLTIGSNFSYASVNPFFQIILGEWLYLKEGIRFYLYLNICESDKAGRHGCLFDDLYHKITQALRIIRYGDSSFFQSYFEAEQWPIVAVLLYKNPIQNKAINVGTFAEYKDQENTENTDLFKIQSIIDNHVLIDEKVGDVTGDGILDKISLFGDKLPDSKLIHNIVIEVQYGQSDLSSQIITEISGMNPTIFLGDFTKNKMLDILVDLKESYDNLNSRNDKSYGAFINTYRDKGFVTIFSTNHYNKENSFLAEFMDFYKIRILNVQENGLFYLDISNMGYRYLDYYYDKNGLLRIPALAKVQDISDMIPIVSDKKNNYYDILAIHRIVGENTDGVLGYVANQLSWNGERFSSVQLLVYSTGTNLIPTREA